MLGPTPAAQRHVNWHDIFEENPCTISDHHGGQPLACASQLDFHAVVPSLVGYSMKPCMAATNVAFVLH